ncbi:MAG: DUF934 domain-containing protein [Gammaproteobacteria bacterium]|nr:DUF934 domain-containing protein [Gammaproteobacteria bacterium]
MPTLVRDLEIVPDEWTLVDAGDVPDPVAERTILPFEDWLERRAALPVGRTGIWVEGDAEAEAIGPHAPDLALIAVRFPAFADGRGLSLGALLRTRYGFEGELRAYGDILPDLAQYLHRSGFDAFVLADRRSAEVAIASVGSITDHYQASVRQPAPAFRRR